jgi:hypothetical protein
MIMNNIKIAKKKPIEIEVIQITGTDENIKSFHFGGIFFCPDQVAAQPLPES